jgi:hypothetical protein
MDNQQKLFEHVKKFMISNGVECEESIYQVDSIRRKAEEFMETCWRIVYPEIKELFESEE